jgi:hypothetical protein
MVDKSLLFLPPPSSGEVSPSYGDGGGKQREEFAEWPAPSVRFADTSPEDGGGGVGGNMP